MGFPCFPHVQVHCAFSKRIQLSLVTKPGMWAFTREVWTLAWPTAIFILVINSFRNYSISLSTCEIWLKWAVSICKKRKSSIFWFKAAAGFRRMKPKEASSIKKNICSWIVNTFATVFGVLESFSDPVWLEEIYVYKNPSTCVEGINLQKRADVLGFL